MSTGYNSLKLVNLAAVGTFDVGRFKTGRDTESGATVTGYGPVIIEFPHHI